jgi:hypothetical protein
LLIGCDSTAINLKLISTYIPGLLYLCIGPEFQLPEEVMGEMKQQMPHLAIKIGSAQSDDI